MSQNAEQQAAQVVATFKSQLSKSGIEHVGQQHFAQLQLLIESALMSVSVQQSAQIADKLQALAQTLRRDSESGF